MALIKCTECGSTVSDKADACPVCGKPVASILRELQGNEPPAPGAEMPGAAQSLPPVPEPAPVTEPVSAPEIRVTEASPATESPAAAPTKKKGSAGLIAAIAAAVLLLAGAGGFFYYKSIYLPKKIDAEAPRYYTYAPSVLMRSSEIAGVDYNKMGSLPYGTELITYSINSEWCHAKVNSESNSLHQQVGYVAAPYVLEKSDFFRLNSIFGDTDSKEIVKTAKCRKALLDYFKENGYIGNISVEEASALGLPNPATDNQWQLFCKLESSKKNNVYYARILDKNSKFTDFAAIIKNIHTGERKLLFFAFNDDETVRYKTEAPAPEYGCIDRIRIDSSYDSPFGISASYVNDND